MINDIVTIGIAVVLILILAVRLMKKATKDKFIN